MRLRSSLIIVGMSFLTIYLGTWVYLEIESIYSTEIAVTLYSEHNFNKKVESLRKGENLLFVRFTELDSKEYPVIKELIDRNLEKEIPKNDNAKISVSYDELKEIHQYMAKKYAQKYNTNPDDYITINDEMENDEPLYHTFEEELFTVDGVLYNFGQKTYAIEDPENVELEVHTQEMNHFIRNWEVADLTNDDLDNIPKLAQVIAEIGKYDENVQSRKGVTAEEFEKYRQWAKSLQLLKGKSTDKNAFLEYDGKKYQLFFRER